MKLSTSVALSILGALSVQGLVIPSVGDIIDVFALDVKKVNEHDDQQVAKVDAIPVNSAPAPILVDKVAGTTKDEAPFFTLAQNIIPHRYIIVLKEGVSKDELDFHKEWVALTHTNSLSDLNKDHEFFVSTKDFKAEGGIVDSFHIENLFSGYTGYFLESTIELIRKNPLVQFVEQDSIVNASEFEIEKGAPWGLARVSHRQPLSLNSFNQYLYDNEAGKGVTSYVIDTGINVDHVEFNGRAKWGSTIPYGDQDIDGNGHGTHCAGTIASDAYGVAKGAEVVAVKVLRSNGSGSMSDVVKGVEFAAQSHTAAAKANKKGFKGSTANMSLGGGKSPALDLAVNAAVKAGIHFAVAAGNENQDACNTSPAAAENAITVGASTISDVRAYFSNYGKCVDIFAPGLNILSTYIGSTTSTATLSGTSMASPHIAGLLSYFLSLQPGAESEYFVASNGVSPEQLKKNLIAYGSKGVLGDIPDDGTPNILAFNGAGHNLTEFWAPGSKAEQVSIKKGKHGRKHKSIEKKIAHLLEDVDAPTVLEEVKALVDAAYNKVHN
ncbi:vacuolar protease B [Scheffersomyces amazonensis]|uniref:vacuolar protease B n=1 Tax=Scheffersomyces amazonensis TaxID=1078765 RepID=UPI00315C84B4